MGISTATLAYVAIGASAVGAGVSAYGSIEASQAQAASARYNAEIAQQNAGIADRNATMVGQAGEQQAAVVQQKTRSEVGAIEASQAASNVDVNTGSAVDVRSSAAALGELNALTVRSNAAKEAYGYQTQAVGYENEAKLNYAQGEADVTAGEIGAAGSLIGGIGSSASSWNSFMGSNSLTPIGNGTTLNSGTAGQSIPAYVYNSSS